MHILMTGAATKGSLGWHIAMGLISAGHTITAFGKELKRDPDLPAAMDYIHCDLGDYNSIAGAVRCVGPMVDGVINCAGINKQDWIEQIDPGDWLKLMQVNCLAPVLVAGDLLNSKKIRTPGSFVCNIVSNASHLPMTASNAYNASKGALHIATLQMARELTPKHGISVFGVSPNKLAGTGMSKQIEREVQRVRGWTPEFAHEYQVKSLLNKQETPPQVVADFIIGIVNNPGVTRFLSGCILPIGA